MKIRITNFAQNSLAARPTTPDPAVATFPVLPSETVVPVALGLLREISPNGEKGDDSLFSVFGMELDSFERNNQPVLVSQALKEPKVSHAQPKPNRSF
jgi:hypothetical protein